MNKSRLLGAVLFCVIASTQESALATLITFNFEGVVTASRHSLESDFFGGEFLTGSFTYDTSYTDQALVNTAAGVYGFPDDRFSKFVTAFSATIGTHQLGLGTNSTLKVLVDDGTGVYEKDEFQLQIHNPTHPTLPICGGACSTEFFTINLYDFSKTAFSSDAIPSSLDITAFDTTSWGLSIKGGDVGGTISDISAAPIPEPTTLALMALGIAGIGLSMRSRDRAA